MLTRWVFFSFRRQIVLACLGIAVLGCTREENPPAPPATVTGNQPLQSVPEPALLFHEPIPVQRGEVPAAALESWRQFAAIKPTLLLLSSDTMLTPVPESLQPEVAQWLRSASLSELTRRGTPQQPDLLLTPAMTLDAALRAGLFFRLAWAMPQRSDGQPLSLDDYRQKFRASGQFSAAEAESLTSAGPALQGTVRGVPLLASALPSLPEIRGPVVVHIDQSYFQGLYKNEVSTPLLPLVLQVVKQLRERKLLVQAVTFNYGNVEGRISLDVRFLGEVLTRYVEHPETFAQAVPVNWERQGQIFYLREFIKREEIVKLAQAMGKADPTSAWVNFSLYRCMVENKESEPALAYLAAAVARDRIYALEYLALAGKAYEAKRPDAAMKMLQLAAAAFPDNPQLLLQLAQLAGEMGDRTTARQLVAQLQKLPWSSVYYPEMAAYLRGFDEYLQAPASATTAESASAARPKGVFPARHLMGRPSR